MKKTLKDILYRVPRYEYWPYLVFYLPLYFYYILLAIRARGLAFISNVNPGIEHGGMINESKAKLTEMIPQSLQAKTLFFKNTDNFSSIKEQLKQEALDFPLVIKPNEGERGKNVVVLKNDQMLKNYLEENDSELFHIQEFLTQNNEAGVFIIDHPIKGFFISSITTKTLFELEGDGEKTLSQLVNSEFRYAIHYEKVRKLYPNLPWDEVIPSEKKVMVDPVGNHARGAIFHNANKLITKENTEFFKSLTYAMKGIHYGRFDIKFDNIPEFKKGKGIKVIEFNGAFAEPGHIYDPKEKLINAYRDMMKHWLWASDISIDNKNKGVPYSKLGDLIRLLWQHFFPKK